jgi:hypothetical protein
LLRVFGAMQHDTPCICLEESWESPNMHAGSGGDGNKIAHRLNLNTV